MITRFYTLTFLALFLSICFSVSAQRSSNCKPAPPPFSGYSFISPLILDPEKRAAPYFVDFEALERYYARKGDPQIQGNLQEWQERFCEIPTIQDIGVVVYQASITDMEMVHSAIRSPSLSLPYRLAENTFALYLRKNKCLETVEYLIFAKECEQFVVRSDAWKDAPATKRDRMQRLIERGLDEFRRLKSDYIKLRYAYQIIRLAHYSKQYEQVLELHGRLMPRIANDPSILDHWIMGHRAGALMALGDNVEASYLFSRIFEECPSKRESAYRSFKIKTDEEWEKCLLRCQNDRERATLYAIRANFPDSKLVVEMKNIYRLAPTSPYLDLLLIEELRKLERHLLGLSFNDKRSRNQRYYNIPAPDAGERVVALQLFVSQVLEERLIDDPELWRLAEGYLYFLSGNYYDARQAFHILKKINPEPIIGEQMEAFELAMQISSYQKVDDSLENQVAYIRRIDDTYEAFGDFEDFTNDKMVQLYRQNNMPGKAFLLQHPLRELKPNPQPQIVEELIGICLEPSRTRLENQLVAVGDSTFLNELLDIKASYLMNNYQLEAALETLKGMDRVEWDNYGVFNPFVDRINDCVNCRLPSNVTVYNKGEILERLLDLEYRARARTGNPGQDYYQIGLALYNMSYFSHAWRVMDYYRSGASLKVEYLKDGDNVIPHPDFPFGNREHFDCSQARYYFEQARLYTDSSEIAAKATFMAAKCERNEYYINRWKEDAQQTFENFKLLTDNYSDTEFYQLILEECKYFYAYVNK